MFPVIRVENPQYRKLFIMARTSFFVVELALSINDLSMYLQAPSNIVCKHSTGIELNKNETMHVCITQ